MPLPRLLLVSLVISTSCFCLGQENAGAEIQSHVTKGTLQITKTVLSNDIARDFTTPLHCDADGNVYYRSESDGFPSIHKITLKGERGATFVPSSCSDIKVHLAGNFFVAADGHVYQIANPPEGMQQFVLVYDDDGACHSKIKLDTPFHFMPYQLVTFPSGNMLISGTRWNAQSKQYVPYTALFSSSGTVLKEVDFEGEQTKSNGIAASSASDSAGHSQGLAVSGGAMRLAGDNNAYFFGREAAPTVYAISEGATVVRHFRVDPGNPDLMAEGMQIAGNRIAILFADIKAHRALIKVVDLEGKELAQYDVPTQNGRIALPVTLSCYSYPPEGFTFLSSNKDDKVTLQTVEPH